MTLTTKCESEFEIEEYKIMIALLEQIFITVEPPSNINNDNLSHRTCQLAQIKYCYQRRPRAYTNTVYP